MHLSKADVARVIVNFLEGTGGPWDWDDFISIPLHDPSLEAVRLLAARLPDVYPPSEAGHYCSEPGLAELRQLAEDLRRG